MKRRFPHTYWSIFFWTSPLVTIECRPWSPPSCTSVHSSLNFLHHSLTLQNCAKTNMDARYRTLRLCFYIQHRCHSALPTQATPDYHKRSMVRFEPYPPPRSMRPTSSQGLPGTDCYPSLSSGLASQPPCGTTSTPVKQQATKTTIDIWWATLRLRRWTPPSPPPTNDRTLARRKRCFHVFWLLIMDK